MLRDELSSSDSGLDAHTRNFLEPYMAENCSTRTGLHKADLQHQIDDENLWACDSNYDSWICCLTEALCVYNRDHLLWPKCARLCSLKASFAELVFPYLLFEVFLCSRNAGQGHMRSKVSDALKNKILVPANIHISAIRVVIRALEFFNAFRCNIIAYPGSTFADEVLNW